MSHGLSVLRFAAAMEEKLIENDHKGWWEACTLPYLLHRLRQENVELERAVSTTAGSTNPLAAAGVLREAADVANFAMMIADRARAVIDENVERANERNP